MEVQIRKMAHALGVTVEVARTLWEAGYHDLRAFREASRSELEALPGIGPATAKKLKAR